MAPLVRLGRGTVPLLQRVRDSFRGWRRTRPFWGGLWCMLAGALIALGPFTALKVILISGTIVWLGLMVGILVGVMGLLLWFAPELHILVGVLAVLFSMVSLITSNYGGFGIGLLLGTIGGALGFAWTPVRAKKT